MFQVLGRKETLVTNRLNAIYNLDQFFYSILYASEAIMPSVLAKPLYDTWMLLDDSPRVFFTHP